MRLSSLAEKASKNKAFFVWDIRGLSDRPDREITDLTSRLQTEYAAGLEIAGITIRGKFLAFCEQPGTGDGSDKFFRYNLNCKRRKRSTTEVRPNGRANPRETREVRIP